MTAKSGLLWSMNKNKSYKVDCCLYIYICLYNIFFFILVWFVLWKTFLECPLLNPLPFVSVEAEKKWPIKARQSKECGVKWCANALLPLQWQYKWLPIGILIIQDRRNDGLETLGHSVKGRELMMDNNDPGTKTWHNMMIFSLSLLNKTLKDRPKAQLQWV